jgi:hypothetical protein
VVLTLLSAITKIISDAVALGAIGIASGMLQSRTRSSLQRPNMDLQRSTSHSSLTRELHHPENVLAV